MYVEQNPPETHLPLIADINFLMRRLDLVRLLGVRQPVVLSRLPPPVVTDAEMMRVFSSDMVDRILSYCMLVAVASAFIATVLPLAAVDRAPKWPLS